MRHAALVLGLIAVLVAVPAVAGARPHHYAPPPPARYVPPTQSEADMTLLGLGVRVSGIAFEGTKLSLGDFENPVMGGVGLQFRAKFSRHWGLEVAADYLRGADGDFVQWTVPVTLSALVYFFPDSRIDLYGLFGGGVHFTSLEYEGGAFTHDLLELGGHVGAGVQIRITRNFAIQADLRFMGLYKNLDEEMAVRDDCLRSAGGETGFCSAMSRYDSGDRFNLGLQFLAGATYYF